MLVLAVVSGGRNEEPRADAEGCQEFCHVTVGAERVRFGHGVLLRGGISPWIL